MTLGDLTRRVERGDRSAFRPFVEQLARDHRITICWTGDRCEWYAVPARRFVSIPPPIDDVSLAIALHEIAHVLIRESEERLHAETLAWERAQQLVPFSIPMFRRLQKALMTYRRWTPASRTARLHADRAMAFLPWALNYQKRRKWNEMLARQERARASLRRT